MGRATLILRTPADRAKAKHWIDRAPHEARVEFKASKRTIPQNDRLHAMVTEIAEAMPWHGQKLSVDDWKLLFMDALKKELRIAPNLDGNGFVNLGHKTSRLTVQECGDLMELVAAFAAKHGVELSEPARKEDAA